MYKRQSLSKALLNARKLYYKILYEVDKLISGLVFCEYFVAALNDSCDIADMVQFSYQMCIRDICYYCRGFRVPHTVTYIEYPEFGHGI